MVTFFDSYVYFLIGEGNSSQLINTRFISAYGAMLFHKLYFVPTSSKTVPFGVLWKDTDGLYFQSDGHWKATHVLCI